MNEKLKFILEKCFTANPSREEDWDWDGRRPRGSGFMDHTPCRLGDVLRALNSSEDSSLFGFTSSLM
jgi:hypothetical protein